MLLLMPCIASVDSNAGAAEDEAYRVTAPETEIREAVLGSTEAVSSIPGPSPDIGELRRILKESGFDTAKYTDDQLEPLAKSFSGKKLVGKYQWNDPTGINWLLEKAGVDTRIRTSSWQEVPPELRSTASSTFSQEQRCPWARSGSSLR